MKIGKTFVDGLVREVGRSGGKVIANKVYGTAHSTPVKIVQEMDKSTTPLYNGSRKTYRHDLDRIINGDLPSAKAKAKKQIVSMEDALAELFNKDIDVSNHLAWLQSSDDYLTKVLKIVSDSDVENLANEARENIAGYRGGIIDAVKKLEYPENPNKKKKTSKIFLIIGLSCLAIAIGALLYGDSLGPEDALPENFNALFGFLVVFGIVMLIVQSKKKTKENKDTRIYNRTVNTIDEYRELISEYES